MGIGEIVHIVVLSAFIVAILLALLSVMLDDAMKELRGLNGIFAYLFLLGGGGSAIRQCFEGISNITGFSAEDIANFLFRELPAAITVLAIVGFFIWFAISSAIDKRKKKDEKEEINDKNSTLH